MGAAMERRETARGGEDAAGEGPEGGVPEPELKGGEDAADEDGGDAAAAEADPDLEDPRLYSPLLAHDEPCLERRRTESAAAGRSMIPCEDASSGDEAGDEASGARSVEEAPEDGA